MGAAGAEPRYRRRRWRPPVTRRRHGPSIVLCSGGPPEAQSRSNLDGALYVLALGFVGIASNRKLASCFADARVKRSSVGSDRLVNLSNPAVGTRARTATAGIGGPAATPPIPAQVAPKSPAQPRRRLTSQPLQPRRDLALVHPEPLRNSLSRRIEPANLIGEVEQSAGRPPAIPLRLAGAAPGDPSRLLLHHHQRARILTPMGRAGSPPTTFRDARSITADAGPAQSRSATHVANWGSFCAAGTVQPASRSRTTSGHCGALGL